MTRRRVIALAVTALALPFATVLPATTPAAAAPAPSSAPLNDFRHWDGKLADTFQGKKIDLPTRYEPSKARKTTAAAAATPPVGTVRNWLAIDDTQAGGAPFPKAFTLRGVGEKIEVWVANDLSFPAGDCRAQIPNSTTITDAQVAYFVNEFDTNMYPKETAAFSTPPDRDGTNARIPGDYTGDGDKTVALIDNIRDDNFYDFPANPTYIAGFFSAGINERVDRNVMTVDAFDWAHRTGDQPADEPTGDLCTSRPARPNAYEGTFAHEWQHLLMYYTDPFEGNWINEGLSDFAQTLTGYVDARATINDYGADSHIYCFQGFGNVQARYNPNPRQCGGPQNSLTLWGEGEPGEVLADYGNAYEIMLFLYDRYGADFMSTLHRDGERQGLASLEAALKAEGADLYRVIHDYQSMVLLDRIVESRTGVVLGVPKSRVTSASLSSTVNLANPDTYDTPGAAPNGADYVTLQKADGKPFKGSELRTLKFTGATGLPALPLAWTIVNDEPDRAGNPVLFSGNENNLNVSAVAEVTVPAADPTLRLLAKYGAEEGYDYGYVVVSTDGGATYTPVSGDQTVEGPLGPSLNGTTSGFEPHTFDLSAYAGQNVLLGFQYVSDGGVNEGGLYLDDITVGGTVVSDGSSLEPFDSFTEIKPTAVHNWNVRLVGLDEKHKVAAQVEFNGKGTINLNRLELLLARPFTKIVAIVAYDEPTELGQQYAPYTLTVNGVTQPGG
ncbi:immune inhibitor A domain-containing protein [Herbidospora cretacea]|uniref:immune inhibitor A domain-containing protein n=1 Tax=Herbidospora cretacea TaxID=28444 RepID=UPI0004C42C6B|nr:immune inhibitor A domain-containing protein [Herbidospora cretacea]